MKACSVSPNLKPIDVNNFLKNQAGQYLECNVIH